MPPIRLSDAELDAVFDAARPINPDLRDRFLRAVAHALQQDCVGEIGPGTVARVCRELHGVTAQTSNIGAGRTVSGTVNALVAAYLDPNSSSPFKTGAAETQRGRRNILENFRKAYGDKPLFRADNNGRRTMLLTREHLQRIVNEKSTTSFAQRNFQNRCGLCSNGRPRKEGFPTTRRLALLAKRRNQWATRHGPKIKSPALRTRIRLGQSAACLRTPALHRPASVGCRADGPAACPK